VRIADPPTVDEGHRYQEAAYGENARGPRYAAEQAAAQQALQAQQAQQAHLHQVQAQVQAQAHAAVADAIAAVHEELAQLRQLSEKQSRLAMTVLCITAAVAVVLLLATFQTQSRLHYTTECLLWHAKASRST